MRISRSEFEGLVEEAITQLPEQFANLLDNVVVVVEEEPTDEDLDVLGDDAEEDELLGIYRGVSRPHRTLDMPPMLPDQIAIFRGPILRIAETRRQALREIRETVIHELGHYFGLGDDEMVY